MLTALLHPHQDIANRLRDGAVDVVQDQLRIAQDGVEGVRSSWLMLARNCDLWRLAASSCW